MKGYLTLIGILGALLCASASSLGKPVDEIWPVPQKDGSTRWMTRGQATLQAILTEPLAVASPRNLDKVSFFLYTQSNPTVPFEIDMNDPSSLTQSNFDVTHPTRFFVHGWNGEYTGPQATKIRESLLLNGENNQYNFIAVDWSVYADTINYISAKNSCSETGEIVAEFIDWLYSAGNLLFDTLALYGHSLGAHVVGFAGKNVKQGRIPVIIGLDTAMPLFDYYDPNSRLADTDAAYVECMHTNGGFNGFYKPIGHADFYPNGGVSQPGCGVDLDGSCAHQRVIDYMAEALSLGANNRFNAVGCSALSDVALKTCNLNSGGVRMGDPNNSNTASGIYYLETNDASPYGIGN